MDPHPRDEATESVLRDIIAHGSDAIFEFLNDKCTDGLETLVEEEEAGYDDDQTMEEGRRDDGSGDRTEEDEGHRDDGSGDRTESGQVYILIKHVLTIAN